MDLDTIKSEYLKREKGYEKLKSEIIYILERELKSANIPYHMIDGRIKELDSVIAKARPKAREQEYEDIDRIIDICGVRIICLFLSDIEKIGLLIEKGFEVEDKDDKVLSKAEAEFGYLSVHYVGKLPSDFSGPRYNDIKGLRFEIQVRTIAMHSWATISHYLHYKSEHSVPSELRKDFQALSALFYLADSHFELFFRKGQESKQIVEEKARRASGIADEEINLDTLSIYLKRKFPEREHNTNIEDISGLVEDLVAAGYRRIGEVDRDLERSMEACRLYEEKYPPVDSETDELDRFTDLGVVRVALELIKERFFEGSRKRFGLDPSDEFWQRYEEFRKYVK
jgi:ppGpp synthetase/RelA/SpoT-type nucleotidyltranferase